MSVDRSTLADSSLSNHRCSSRDANHEFEPSTHWAMQESVGSCCLPAGISSWILIASLFGMKEVPMRFLADLALFVEVANTGNFGRAAATLGMPASTLSRRI